MSSDDMELLRQKRAAELRRKLLLSKLEEEKRAAKAIAVPRQTPREVVRKALVGRALEVLETARRSYPAEIAELERSLAQLIENGRLKGPITGEELYAFLRRAGLQFSLNTKIRVVEGGELKTLEQKLKGKLSEDKGA